MRAVADVVSSWSDNSEHINKILSSGADAMAVSEYFHGARVAVTADGIVGLVGRLAVDRKKVSRLIHLLAAVSLILWLANLRRCVLAVARDVRAVGGRCITFFEGLRLDETPMKMGVVDASSSVELLGRPLIDFVRGDRGAWGARCQDNAIFKVLQTEYTFGALTEIQGIYRLCVWRPPTPYLAMAATSASCYFRCLVQSEAWFDLAEVRKCFDRVERALVSDGDSAIDRAERARRLLHPAHHSFRRVCMLHKASADTEAVNALDRAPFQGSSIWYYR